MANERLRGCIAAAGLTLEDVARRTDVDPKTVERWISQDRLPQRRHRWKTAALLEKDETYLWPSLATNAQVRSASDAELVTLYSDRGAVPGDMWARLVDDATDGLDVLVYSGLFLVDTRPDMAAVLADKARNGVSIRLLLGDPDSTEVARRGDEEGIGTALASRIKIALSYLAPAVGTPGVEIRTHDTILYNSIYRSDGTMLVNTHVHGAGAGFNPVLHLQRVPGGRIFDHYQASFDRVWDTGKPIERSS